MSGCLQEGGACALRGGGDAVDAGAHRDLVEVQHHAAHTLLEHLIGTQCRNDGCRAGHVPLPQQLLCILGDLALGVLQELIAVPVQGARGQNPELVAEAGD